MSDFYAIIEVPNAGRLAISALPHKSAHFDIISRWQPALILSLTQATEGPKDISERLAGLAKHKYIVAPIADFSTPQQLTPDFMQHIAGHLNRGDRIWVHCRAGYGRSGMVVLRALIDCGVSPKDALGRLRELRAGAVETPQQLYWASYGALGQSE